jgi:putative DNA-invertase from lambdoid prophage Rac
VQQAWTVLLGGSCAAKPNCGASSGCGLESRSSRQSALDILGAVERFEARGVRLFVLRDSIETGGASGRLIITALAGVAQLERDLISERMRVGLRAARTQGSKLGRPRAYLSPRALDEVRSGHRTAASLAREVGVSVMTVRRRIKEVA